MLDRGIAHLDVYAEGHHYKSIPPLVAKSNVLTGARVWPNYSHHLVC